jgi:hypothetical protein
MANSEKLAPAEALSCRAGLFTHSKTSEIDHHGF